MKEEKIEITLSLPPSVNKLYANSKKWRTKTEEYKGWEKLAFYEYKEAWTDYKITWNNWLWVEYQYFLPCYTSEWKIRKVDVENLIKATSDALWKLIPWFDDSKIKTMLIRKEDSIEKYVRITIKEI